MERLPRQPGAASPGACRPKLGGGVLRKGGWERARWGLFSGQPVLPSHPHPQEGLQGFFPEKSLLCGPILQSLRGETRENGFRQATWEPLAEQAVGILRTCPNAQLSPPEAS